VHLGEKVIMAWSIQGVLMLSALRLAKTQITIAGLNFCASGHDVVLKTDKYCVLYCVASCSISLTVGLKISGFAGQHKTLVNRDE